MGLQVKRLESTANDYEYDYEYEYKYKLFWIRGFVSICSPGTRIISPTPFMTDCRNPTAEVLLLCQRITSHPCGVEGGVTYAHHQEHAHTRTPSCTPSSFLHIYPLSDLLPKTLLSGVLRAHGGLLSAVIDNMSHAGVAAASWLVVVSLRCVYCTRVAENDQILRLQK